MRGLRRLPVLCGTPFDPERGVVFDGVRSRCPKTLPGDFAIDRTVRMDREILRVMGRWLGVGRVGVLNTPDDSNFPRGVVGRTGGVPNSSWSNSSWWPCTGVPGRAGIDMMFSLPSAADLPSWALKFIWECVVVSSPRTLGCPSFLGDGNRSLLVLPRSSSTAMGLSAVPLPLE